MTSFVSEYKKGEIITGGDLRNKHMRSQRHEQKQFNLLFSQTKTAVGYILTVGVLPRLRAAEGLRKN